MQMKSTLHGMMGEEDRGAQRRQEKSTDGNVNSLHVYLFNRFRISLA